MTEFRMPSLGADMQAGTLVSWLRKPGESLKRGDVIAEVETEKGLIEVELYSDGVLDRYLVEPGTKVPVGTPLALLRDGAETAESAREAKVRADIATTSQATERAAALDPQMPSVRVEQPALGPPSVRRRARELGVDLTKLGGTGRVPTMRDVEQLATVQTHAAPPSTPRVRISPVARRRAVELGLAVGGLAGTGPDGAVILRDVEAASVGDQSSAVASENGPSPVDRKRAMRRAIGAAMARSKREIPHYYVAETIDMGPAIAWLSARNAQHGISERVLPSVLLLKAVALAAHAMPDFNAHWIQDEPHSSERVHLGIAISLRGGGLVAPAIHDADQLSLASLMTKLEDLVTRARAGSLRSSELSDGTLTVTSLGDRGVESVMPIIFPPQTAIVGFGRILERPWVVDGAICARPLVHTVLAADHRATDGHSGARFLALIAQHLQHPEKL